MSNLHIGLKMLACTIGICWLASCKQPAGEVAAKLGFKLHPPIPLRTMEIQAPPEAATAEILIGERKIRLNSTVILLQVQDLDAGTYDFQITTGAGKIAQSVKIPPSSESPQERKPSGVIVQLGSWEKIFPPPVTAVSVTGADFERHYDGYTIRTKDLDFSREVNTHGTGTLSIGSVGTAPIGFEARWEDSFVEAGYSREFISNAIATAKRELSQMSDREFLMAMLASDGSKLAGMTDTVTALKCAILQWTSDPQEAYSFQLNGHEVIFFSRRERINGRFGYLFSELDQRGSELANGDLVLSTAEGPQQVVRLLTNLIGKL